LGQNFAKAFDVKFLSKENQLEYVWATSWGVSTRLMGALIMTHSDDKGLVLPPTLAPIQVVLVPIFKNEEMKPKILEYLKGIEAELKEKKIVVKVDDSENYSPGYKFAEYEMKGVPIRIAIGARDVENNTVEVARRDTLTKESAGREGIAERVFALLVDIQSNLYQKALELRKTLTYTVDTWDEFVDVIENKGGFVYAHWDGTSETEEKIKELTKATIRLIPLEEGEPGKCVLTGKPSAKRVVFAKAY
ncbi:MAG TPA: His/Gly/Thr/Pro-type tRNA ligase C-terminal domain-containing protein, partial [Bacteroidales bacterium]|nr:His/Gly/Thr/Pro-type tRNA ligase C-terminal domain-containing protein [Bacteroidales bacterium]